MSAAIVPDHILSDMAELWVSLGKEGENEAGVLRACSMTLVVAAEESDDSQAIGETLAALMPEHPSRAIVIRFRADERRDMSARVFAQCWMPFSQRRQICCEQIEVMTSHTSIPDLAPVVLPLVAPDLPVVLWCRSPRLFHLETFPQLEAIAQKLVIDSRAFDSPPAILREISTAVAAGRVLADLSWGRLTRWRELIAQLFEARERLGGARQPSELRITHTGTVTPVTAFYMAAWLIAGFAEIGNPLRLTFASVGKETPGRLCRLDLLREASDPVASIASVEGRAAEIRVGDLVHRAMLPKPTDYSLMREELSISGHDPVFDRTLAAAAQLALS
jgi:glucose-6-phosphate dehydrogenase assembly protein OpcA